MGRNTYDMICSFGTWPYGDKPTWICSSRPVTPMKGMNLQKEILPEETIQAAKAKGLQHVWLVGGGKLASSFIDKSLLTDITISQMPVILGGGFPLFAPMQDLSMLTLKSCEKYPAGFSQIEYKVKQ